MALWVQVLMLWCWVHLTSLNRCLLGANCSLGLHGDERESWGIQGRQWVLWDPWGALRRRRKGAWCLNCEGRQAPKRTGEKQKKNNYKSRRFNILMTLIKAEREFYALQALGEWNTFKGGQGYIWPLRWIIIIGHETLFLLIVFLFQTQNESFPLKLYTDKNAVFFNKINLRGLSSFQMLLLLLI